MNLLPVLSFVLQLYEVAVQAIFNIVSTALYIFNDHIIMIVDHSKDIRMYVIPILNFQVTTHGLGLRFYPIDKNKNIELASIKFVKKGKIYHKIAKNETVNSMSKVITEVSALEIEKNEREFMKRYVFVELGGINISKYFYQIAWSLDEKIIVKDLQKMLSINGEDISLDFTDDNLVVEQRHSDQKVLDQVDLIKRS